MVRYVISNMYMWQIFAKNAAQLHMMNLGALHEDA